MSIRVELELDDGSFTTGMLHAGESVRQFQNNVGQGITSVRAFNETTHSFIGTLRDVSITLGMARMAFESVRGVTTGWAADIVKVNAEMEKLTFLLRGMSNAADTTKDAANQVKYLRDAAKEAPFSLKELTDTFVKMKSTGIDPLAGGFKAMVDGVAAFGGTDDVLKRATVAISQMAGKGVIQMEELRQQLGEAMPRAVEIMARSMGETTGQLIQDISKGTLEAKSALSNFFIESERTFGGAAAQQMQTFNGRLSQMHTLMQSLALTAGQAGFFDTVKNQLRDINVFLGGSQAQQFATIMGQGLNTVVNSLRGAVDWMIRFHSEILSVGEIMAVAFASRIAIGGLLSMSTYLGGLVTQTRAFGLALTSVSGSLQMINFGRLINQLTAGANGFTFFEGAARRVSAILPLIGMSLGFIGSVAIPVVGGLIAAAMAFGLFSDKAKDAYENMEKFGAQSRKEAEAATVYASAIEKQIALLRQLKETNDTFGTSGAGGIDNQDLEQEIAKKEQLLAEVRAKGAEQRKEGAKHEAEREMQVQNDALSEQLFQASKAYDEQAKTAAKSYNDQRNLLIAANGDTSVLDANYQQDHQQMVIDSLKAEYQIREDWVQANTVLMSEGNDKALLIGDKFNNEQFKAQKDLQDKITSLQDGVMKATQLGKGIDIEKMLERSKSLLDSLKEDAVGLQADLAGASSEYAKLIYRIEDAASKSQSLGPRENARIKAVTDELRQQIVVVDQLNQAVAGRRKLDSELDSIGERVHSALTEAVNNSKSPFDQLWSKMRDGAFSGLSAIERMLRTTGDAGKSAADNIKVMFGPDMIGGANSFLTPLQQIAAQMGVIAVEGNKIGGLSTTFNRFNGKGYYDNLVANESSGNPNAHAEKSSAAGPAQFLKDTWLQFLREMRPDITGTESQKLGMRSQAGLNEEAVTWLNSRNAPQLMKAGVPTNDANMYLAHFLGAGGAIDVLTKSSDTALRSIPSIAKAIESNPKVFDKLNTTGDLQNWSANRFGTAFTARTGEADPRNMAQMIAGVGGPESPEGQKLMKAFQESQLARTQEMRNALEKKMKDLAIATQKAMQNEDNKNKSLTETIGEIREGKYGASRDENDPQYSGLLDKARNKDQADNTNTEKTKIRTQFDQTSEGQEKQLRVFDERIAELKRQLQNEGKFSLSNKYFQAVAAQDANETRVSKGQALGAIGDDEATESRSRAAALVRAQRNQEVVEAIAAEQQKTKAIEKSLLTAGEARELQFQEDVKRNQTLLSLYQGDGEERTRIEEQVARNIKALRAQQFDLTPIGSMLKQWRDSSQNLQQASTGWMNNFNDRLTDMVMKGTTNWRSLTQTISQDLIKLGLQAAESKLFSSILGIGGFSMGGGGAGTSMGTDGLAAIHHTGGVAGSIMPYRSVPMSIFSGARRFHEGSMGSTISGDEIPIIAKKGEQVDWPSNLAKQYGGGGGGNFSMGDINVHSGTTNGSPAQNRELAKQIAGSVRDQVRAQIGSELRLQTRPGGMLRG